MQNPIKATLRRMGNSQGVLIPKTIIAQLGIKAELSMTIEGDTIILRKPPKQKPRYTLAELLAISDYSQFQPDSEREWIDAPKVGREL